ncbi:AAA family ATPase [Actinokineospora sp. HUAS TT18]|uniref:AAA family ATPase n=1 Tax=Actinokineospora sp. HUAS TT18 TaxID=3447451 RepID=UPI003F5283AC
MLFGPPGAGKTTVAPLLAGRFPRGVHVPVDDLRGWVVSGFASPPPWTDEVGRQFVLAQRAAFATAGVYHADGYAVVIDFAGGRVTAEDIDQLAAALPAGAVRKVALVPSLDVNLERNRTRDTKSFPTSVLDDVIRHSHTLFRSDPSLLAGWLVVDSSTLTPEDTADQVIKAIEQHEAGR